MLAKKKACLTRNMVLNELETYDQISSTQAVPVMSLPGSQHIHWPRDWKQPPAGFSKERARFERLCQGVDSALLSFHENFWSVSSLVAGIHIPFDYAKLTSKSSYRHDNWYHRTRWVLPCRPPYETWLPYRWYNTKNFFTSAHWASATRNL